MLRDFSLFILIVFLSKSRPLSTSNRQYVVKKDLIAGFKAGQFSIYSDRAEINLRYRIESYYSPMQKIELHTYPEKNIMGKLDAHQLGIWYEARYEILNTRNASNIWFAGLIKAKSVWFGDKYTIALAERTILVRRRTFSRTYKFFNEDKELLATFQMRYFTRGGLNKYDLKIFSNEFPDSVYMLTIAAHDHKRSKISGAANATDSRE